MYRRRVTVFVLDTASDSGCIGAAQQASGTRRIKVGFVVNMAS